VAFSSAGISVLVSFGERFPPGAFCDPCIDNRSGIMAGCRRLSDNALFHVKFETFILGGFFAFEKFASNTCNINPCFVLRCFGSQFEFANVWSVLKFTLKLADFCPT
jgi:hypothetical protein